MMYLQKKYLQRSFRIYRRIWCPRNKEAFLLIPMVNSTGINLNRSLFRGHSIFLVEESLYLFSMYQQYIKTFTLPKKNDRHYS